MAQYQKIHQQYRSKADADKATIDETVAQAKADAHAEAKAEFEKAQGENLLVVSQFLRLAAYRREESQDPESDESQAIEGVLLAIYAGDQSAVSAMQKLVNGTSDLIASVSAQPLTTTCMYYHLLKRRGSLLTVHRLFCQDSGPRVQNSWPVGGTCSGARS